MRKGKMLQAAAMAAVAMLSASMYLSGCGKQPEPAPAVAEETTEPEESRLEEKESVPESKPEEKEEVLASESETASGVEEDKPDEEAASMENPLGYEIIPMDDTTMYCVSKSANLRAGAGTQYDKVGSLSYGQEITVNGKVEQDGKIWWVLKSDAEGKQMVSGSLVASQKPAEQQKPAQPQQQQPAQAQQPEEEQPSQFNVGDVICSDTNSDGFTGTLIYGGSSTDY